MAVVKLLPAARKDLDGIADDIAEASGNVEVAAGFVRRVYARCKLQATRPLIGELRPELGPRVRQCFVGNYIVFYEPIENGIRVLRVIHGNRDIPKAWRHKKPD